MSAATEDEFQEFLSTIVPTAELTWSDLASLGLIPSTPEPTPAEPPAVSAPSSAPPPRRVYAYPNQNTSGQALSEDQVVLEQRLRELCDARDAQGAPVSYQDIREELCAINLSMNRTGARPPRYRPSRKYPRVLPKGAPATPNLSWITRDALITDLHWLHCRGFRRLLHDSHFRGLMAADEFNFTLAAEFVSIAGRRRLASRTFLS